MKKFLLKLFHQELGGLHRAAVVLAGSSILSGLLGLLRDRLLAGTFGAGQMLDIYYAAFKIPDFLYIISLSIASVTVLIPMLLEKLSVNEENGKEFLNGIFTVFILFMIFLAGLTFFLIPYFGDLVAPGFSPEARNELILLSRILLLSPILLGISNLFSSIVQSFRLFFVYALSPIVYNIGIILGILFFYPVWGLKGIALGVALGALLHVLAQIPSLLKLGFFPQIRAKFNFSEIIHAVKLSLPRSVGLALNQLVFIFITAVASFLGAGSIAIFNLSYNLQSLPLAVIGVSYSVAAFPVLAKLFVSNEKEKFFNHTIVAARQIIFWSVPVSVLLIVLRAQIVRVLFGYGEFGWRDTRLTAAALAIFAVSITAQSLIVLFSRAFYAAGKTLKPILINAFFFLFIIVSIFVSLRIIVVSEFSKFIFESVLRVGNVEGTGMLMLPLFFSVGMILNAVFLAKSFSKNFGAVWKLVRKTLFHVSGASLIMGFTAYFSLNALDKIFDINTFAGIFFQGFVSAFVGMMAWFIILLMTKNEDFMEFLSAMKKRLWKQPAMAIAPEPEELP